MQHLYLDLIFHKCHGFSDGVRLPLHIYSNLDRCGRTDSEQKLFLIGHLAFDKVPDLCVRILLTAQTYPTLDSSQLGCTIE